MKPLLVSLVFGVVSLSAYAELKEFHIAKGTGTGPWNTESTLVEVTVGDTLRIYNDDTVGHRLHTNGAPCDHGPEMDPGTYWDCVIEHPFDATKSGNVYDHDVGPKAPFYVHASPASAE